MSRKLYIVVPCYNEEEVLDISVEVLSKKLSDMILSGIITEESKILLVDDGSKDATWDKIRKQCLESDAVIGLKLSHNEGHQNALLAGMMYAKDKCDIVITIDADLQDDVEVMSEMVQKYIDGSQVVYGVRNERTKDSFFKRTTAQGFYRFMNIMGVETVYNHADYRLLSRVALEALSEYREINLFLRGIVPLIGYKTDVVYYSRNERVAGTTKYPLKKMVNFALDGITSFSVKPLRIISVLGMLCSVLSVSGLLYALISYFMGVTVPGWTAITCSIWLLGGIQLLCIGVLGEYIGKIFSEVKQRPRYIVEEIFSNIEEERDGDQHEE